MIEQFINWLLKPFGIHFHDWKYSKLELFNGYPYFHHYTKRVCKLCGKKQKWVSYHDQEGGCVGGEWWDD